MRTNALHFMPHAGGSCAPPRRSERAAGKNVVRRPAQRPTPSPAEGARCGDHTVTTRSARVTATSRPIQSA